MKTTEEKKKTGTQSDGLRETLAAAIHDFRNGDYDAASDRLARFGRMLDQERRETCNAEIVGHGDIRVMLQPLARLFAVSKAHAELLQEFGLNAETLPHFSKTVKLAEAQTELLAAIETASDKPEALSHYDSVKQIMDWSTDIGYQDLFGSKRGTKDLFNTLGRCIETETPLPDELDFLAPIWLKVALAKTSNGHIAIKAREDMGIDCSKLRPFELGM